MSLAVVLFFAVGTFVEIYLLTIVSSYISIINTLSLIMFTIFQRVWVLLNQQSRIIKLQVHQKNISIIGFLKNRGNFRDQRSIFKRLVLCRYSTDFGNFGCSEIARIYIFHFSTLNSDPMTMTTTPSWFFSSDLTVSTVSIIWYLPSDVMQKKQLGVVVIVIGSLFRV